MVLIRHVAALCLLALALPAAQAQTAARSGAARTLGSGKPAGKLLTRDELRSCFRLQDKLKSDRADYEPQRAEHERVKAEILQGGEALNAEKAAVERRNAEVVAAHKARSDAHGERVAAWNARNVALGELVKKNGARGEIEREVASLEQDKGDLAKAGDALNAEAEVGNRALTEAWNAYSAKAEARNQTVDAFNQRTAAIAERSRALAADSERWKAECADRPYREDDEILIKAGK